MEFIKTIRDPIHKWIKISIQEYNIINSPLLQRLHYIKQLSSVDIVFPGGNHTRLSHSIGVMHLSGKYASHLFPNNIHKIKLARLVGLLHDIGHGPFSHLYDNTVYKNIYNSELEHTKWIKNSGHDRYRISLIKSKYLGKLIEDCGIEINEIIEVWTNPGNIINLIVQGPVGADKMDYMIRDSYYTGTQHLSTISYERIISNSIVVNNILHYKEKVIGDIVHVLQSRFHIYKEVYYNRNVVAGAILLELCLINAMKPFNLIEKTLNVDDFIYLNDGLISTIATVNDGIDIDKVQSINDKNEKKQAINYARRYLQRNLPKMISETVIKTSFKNTVISSNENEIITSHKIEGMSSELFDPYIMIYKTNEESSTFKDYLKNKTWYNLTPQHTIIRKYKL